MHNRVEVARYAAAITRELCRMCREVDLDDVAHLLDVAAAEAVRATAGTPMIEPQRSLGEAFLVEQ